MQRDIWDCGERDCDISDNDIGNSDVGDSDICNGVEKDCKGIC